MCYESKSLESRSPCHCVNLDHALYIQNQILAEIVYTLMSGYWKKVITKKSFQRTSNFTGTIAKRLSRKADGTVWERKGLMGKRLNTLSALLI